MFAKKRYCAHVSRPDDVFNFGDLHRRQHSGGDTVYDEFFYFDIKKQREQKRPYFLIDKDQILCKPSVNGGTTYKVIGLSV